MEKDSTPHHYGTGIYGRIKKNPKAESAVREVPVNLNVKFGCRFTGTGVHS
jgi:hypothetical protein